MKNRFTRLSIVELANLIKNKKISPVDITEEVFKKLFTENKQANMYTSLYYEDSMKEAQIAEKEISQGKYRGPLHGVPLGVKDIIHIEGKKTFAGSALEFNFPNVTTADIVEKLTSNGAIIIGKENMHTLAYGSTGDISQLGPVKNPGNNELISGGSSSGSAASVASNISFGSIGSDTGGSIRIPAALCGVVGMKPTFGSVSRNGTVSLSPTLDTFGPITRTVDDNMILLESITNFKKSSVENHNIKKRIGVPRNFFFDIMDNEIKESFYTTLNELELKGYNISFIEFPYMEEINAAHSIIFATEVYESMKEKIRTDPERIDKEILTRILEGSFIKGHEYINMNRARSLAIYELSKKLQSIDVIMTPTVGAYPCKIGERFIDMNDKRIHIRGVYSRLVKLANLTGFPALSLPTNISENGFSNSVQLIGKPYQEKTLYKYALEIEKLNINY